MQALQKKVAETDNIVPVMSAVIKEVTGGENAEGITYTQNNEEKNIAVDGVFCAIGSVPNTQALEGVCELDESGYVKAGESLTVAELIDFCDSSPNISKYQAPRYYRFVNDLPQTATGKKQHFVIKKQAAEDLKNGLLLKK